MTDFKGAVENNGNRGNTGIMGSRTDCTHVQRHGFRNRGNKGNLDNKGNSLNRTD